VIFLDKEDLEKLLMADMGAKVDLVIFLAKEDLEKLLMADMGAKVDLERFLEVVS